MKRIGSVLVAGDGCSIPQDSGLVGMILDMVLPGVVENTNMKTVKTLFGILTITAALAIQVQAQTFLTNGLVAYYPFNGNANDASGSGNNGTVYGGVTLTTNRFGNANQAYLFGGSSEYITVPCSSTVFSNDFTVSVWVNASDYANAWPTILSERGGSDGTAFVLQIEGQTSGGSPIGSLISYMAPYGAGLGWSLHYLPQFRTSSWIQIVVAKTGTNIAMFLNGQIVVTNTVVNPNTPPSSTLYIGTSADLTAGSDGIFHGVIDDLRIYNRALTANQVAQLYVLESPLTLNVRKAVYLDSPNLSVGTNYQVQVTSDLVNWTNFGTAFTATNSSWRTTNYWDVDNWNQLFFRLKTAP